MLNEGLVLSCITNLQNTLFKDAERMNKFRYNNGFSDNLYAYSIQEKARYLSKLLELYDLNKDIPHNNP